jgi:prefoldin subunit 5
MKEQVTIDLEEYESLTGCYEDLKLLDREYKHLQQKLKELNKLHNNVQAEIEAIKSSIPTIRHHAALDEARWKIEYLEDLYDERKSQC